ncbi:MAG: hypothetical protein ACO1Q7_12530 [Gemmatimonas sp.]
MPRIRTIKPEYWSDEKLARMSMLARLTFPALWNMADDAGRLLDNVKQIDAFVFPFSDDTTGSALEELAAAGVIRRGVTVNGQHIIQITNWHHQKVDHPSLSSCLPVIDGDPHDAAMRYWVAKRRKGSGTTGVPSSAASEPLDVPSSTPSAYLGAPSSTDQRTTRETLDESSRDPRETLARPSRPISTGTSTSIETSSSSSSSSAARDRIASRPDGWQLAAAATAGLRERFGTAQKPLLPQAKILDALRAERVDLTWAIRAVYENTRTFAGEKAPETVNYFASYLTERWKLRLKQNLPGLVELPLRTDTDFTAFELEAIGYAVEGDRFFRSYCGAMGLPWEPAEATA